MAETKLPLGAEVEFRGMTGRDEDILTDRKKVASGDAINEILANCVTRLGELDVVRMKDIEKMESPDRSALLIAIRRESYGDTVECEITCPSEDCKEKFEATVDLGTLKVRELDEDTAFTSKLSDGSQATFGYLNGSREKALLKTKADRATMLLLHRIREVSKADGEKLHRNDVKNWLLNLPVRDRATLRKAMELTDCGPQTDVTMDCPYCATEVLFDAVQGQAGFFFPEG